MKETMPHSSFEYRFDLASKKFESIDFSEREQPKDKISACKDDQEEDKWLAVPKESCIWLEIIVRIIYIGLGVCVKDG